MSEADGKNGTAPDQESADELLAALRRLAAAEEVKIHIEPHRLNHIDSPVAVEADGNIWAYGFLVVAVLVGWQWGLVAGGATLALGVLVYLTAGRAYVHRRIERRVRQDAIGDLAKWRKLWRFSGLTLVAAARPGVAACASPDGNWMAFVRAALATRAPPT
jgi:hypothetical protein